MSVTLPHPPHNADEAESQSSISGWLVYLQTHLTPQQMARICREDTDGGDALEFLFAQRWLPSETILAALAAHHHMPFVALPRYHPSEAALALVPHGTATRFSVLPLFVVDERLYLAVADPLDLAAQDFVREHVRMDVEPVLAARREIADAINRHYLDRDKAAQAMGDIVGVRPQPSQPENDGRGVRVEDEDAPVIRLVNYIFTQAVHMRASDVHLEPMPDRVILRFRVDGMLHEFPSPPAHLYRALVSRIKIISSLDISERRLPQDGRARITVNDRDYDMRVSIIPNLHGEGVVVRVLDPTASSRDLTELGFEPQTLVGLERVLRKPYGLFVVAGPTGSGKTTTLYASLKRIFNPRRKMITLEDPVEIFLDGVTQIQVHPDIGFTFAQGLRAILRHDPDVVMLGEIRDLESAEIALRASLTGHLLFSTIHTNDAPLAVTRLVDMGIPSFLVMSSLIGVLAQRLVRRLCHECRKPCQPSEQQLLALGVRGVPVGATVFEPVGCNACGNLGYKGRVGIHELLEITPQMRRLGDGQIDPGTLKELAGPEFVTLRQSAVAKLLAGVTSMEEVMSITVDED